MRAPGPTTETKDPLPAAAAGPEVVPRAYAGQWVAWSAAGRIVAVAATRRGCEQSAAGAGFPADQVALERVPTTRQRPTGAGR